MHVSLCAFVCVCKGKGMFLYSAVSSPLDRSKRFTLFLPWQTCSFRHQLGFSWIRASTMTSPPRSVLNSSSSSRSHLVVGSLRQTQFSSSQFCHGPHLSSFPMALMSRLIQSIDLCFGLPRFLLPGGIYTPTPESFFLRIIIIISII